MPPASLSDDELLHRVSTLAARSRAAEVDLLRHLAEVDARGLYAREACPSMFIYCTRILRFSEAEAYLRITAARVGREHASLLAALADGRLHLSALARLAPHVTDDNVESLVARAAGRSKREVMELVAELAPRPDVATTIRALPDTAVGAIPHRGPVAPSAGASLSSSLVEGRPFAELSAAAGGPNPAAETSASRSAASLGAPVLCPDRVPAPPLPLSPCAIRPTEPPAASVQPLAPGRYRVQFTADRSLRDKLERLRDLLGLAEGDLARAIDAAVTEKLQRLEARRFAQTAAPRQTLGETDTRAINRHVPAAVRRAVFRRDGGQCRFVDRQGRRCPARRGLEFHHRHPFAMGGNHAVDNLRLLCRAHNRYVADLDFGRPSRAPTADESCGRGSPMPQGGPRPPFPARGGGH